MTEDSTLGSGSASALPAPCYVILGQGNYFSELLRCCHFSDPAVRFSSLCAKQTNRVNSVWVER